MVETGRTILLAGKERSLGETVYKQILAAILDGRLPANTRLPSEARLVKHYGVSRTVIRQALAKLREERYIASRQGSGSYISYSGQPASLVENEPLPISPYMISNPAEAAAAEINGTNTLTFHPIASIADLQRCYDFRVGVEGEAAAAAALNRSEQHLSEMDAMIAELERVAASGEQWIPADFGFHLTVAIASGSHFFVSVIQSLKDQMTTGMMLAQTLSGKDPVNRMRQTATQHRLVLSSICDRDAEEARKNMRKHIEDAKSRLLTGATPAP